MSADSPQNTLVKSIDFGFQVEAFLQSDIGSYLIARAEAQVEDAVEELKAADPFAPKVIAKIQHEIKVAEAIQYWLADAIQSGINAQQQLHEQGV